MNESERIADQLSRIIEGNAWHGLSLFELLKDVDSEKAAQYPVKNVHSIWEIINHIDAWHKAVTRRLNSEVVQLTDEEDWPAVADNSNAEWDKTIEELTTNYKILKGNIISFPSEKFDEKVPGKTDQNFYILLHGIIQHDLYHTGQIAILKKSFLTKESTA
jgi:uncharacterized damage-inducible protein DinB